MHDRTNVVVREFVADSHSTRVAMDAACPERSRRVHPPLPSPSPDECVRAYVGRGYFGAGAVAFDFT